MLFVQAAQEQVEAVRDLLKGVLDWVSPDQGLPTNHGTEKSKIAGVAVGDYFQGVFYRIEPLFDLEGSPYASSTAHWRAVQLDGMGIVGIEACSDLLQVLLYPMSAALKYRDASQYEVVLAGVGR